MIILDIPESVKMHARILAAEIIKRYQGNPDSIRDGEGHYHAKIVELLIAMHFDSEPVNTYDYDQIVIAKDGKRYKTENKVKDRNYPPKPHYLASVSDANSTQKCDRYLFASLVKERVCYLMGYYDAEKFRKDSFECKEGEIDPSSTNGWRFKADCRSMPYSQLMPLIGDNNG